MPSLHRGPEMLPERMRATWRHTQENKSQRIPVIAFFIIKHCSEMYASPGEHKCVLVSVHTNVNHLNVTKPEELIKNNLLKIY